MDNDNYVFMVTADALLDPDFMRILSSFFTLKNYAGFRFSLGEVYSYS